MIGEVDVEELVSAARAGAELAKDRRVMAKFIKRYVSNVSVG